MGRGIINLIIGAVFIIGGLSGQMVFRGTQSSAAIVVVGVLLAGLGIYRIAAARQE